jgi:hypothetical protein
MAHTSYFDGRVVYRFADDVLGEVRRPAAAVPAVSLTVDGRTQYMPAGASVDRALEVQVQSALAEARDVRVIVGLPRGLTADSSTKRIHLSGYGARQSVTFRVRGQLPAGTYSITVKAVAGTDTSDSGYELIDYPHIEPQRIHRPAVVRLRAVNVQVRRGLRVGYIPGVSDNVAPALQQLGIPVTVVPAREVGRTDLSRFTSVVVGPRAFEAHPELAAASTKLFDFARRGGTLVVQYGQYEMTRPGLMPYPITINRPHDRVTRENAPVTILDENAPVLRAPNRITQADFTDWVQERSLYMPRTFDERYTPVLAISDPGEPLNRGGILIAPLGRGTYVYTTLAFFRQLPAGVPGAARLFVNLLSAGLPASPNP